MPDEWQARQAILAILRVSSSKHTAKKITARARCPFHQSITAILTEEKGEKKHFTKPTHVAVYLFGDLDRDSRLSRDDSRSQGQYREQRREKERVCVCVCACVHVRACRRTHACVCVCVSALPAFSVLSGFSRN